jgi:hypothetical protein
MRRSLQSKFEEIYGITSPVHAKVRMISRG